MPHTAPIDANKNKKLRDSIVKNIHASMAMILAVIELLNETRNQHIPPMAATDIHLKFLSHSFCCCLMKCCTDGSGDIVSPSMNSRGMFFVLVHRKMVSTHIIIAEMYIILGDVFTHK